MSWPLMILLAVGSYGLKVVGVTTFGSLLERKFRTWVSLLPTVLFAALIAVMTFENAGELVVDARIAGVAVGAFAAWRKAPLFVVIASAMLATSVLRFVTS
ncbi:MAG: AzlD domain-containing protein [Acidimicrobiaceae bacterium]|nr:AzlD domain-containing protein [Acidimicrobiaceae bacterium]